MGHCNEHTIYLTEDDLNSNVNGIQVFTKHYEDQISLRSHIFENEYLTQLYRGNMFLHRGVKYYINNGFVTGLFILPPNGPGRMQQGVESIPQHLIKTNPNSPFKNTEEDKNKLREILEKRIEIIKNFKNVEIKTGKNLLYYSIFNTGKKYTELLRVSLESLAKYINLNLELLFITDVQTKHDIIEIVRELDIPYDFLLVEPPRCGIEASKFKTKIYNYSRINEYENILFLDADTIFVRHPQDLFNIAQKYEVLYTAYNANLSVEMTESTLYHGLRFYTKDQVENIKNNKQMPFNAGQFMFKNSLYMKMHFENMLWLMDVYPGEYFFEQSFMNHYFNLNLMTDSSLFNKKFLLLMHISNQMYDKNNVAVVHFIGPALDLESKIKHIMDYKKINNLN